MRLLLVTISIAAGVLLLLARLRFPDPPEPVETSTQPLERLAARASFEELAARVARLEATIAPNVIVLSLTSDEDWRPIGLSEVGTDTDRDGRHVPAVRIDATTAAACISPKAHLSGIVGLSAGSDAAGIAGRDRIRPVARVRVPEGRPTALRQLALSGLQTPTYVVAVEGTRAGATIRPVFLGRSDRFDSPRWTRPLLPLGGAMVTSGALMFTLEGQFLGCAIVDEGTAAIASGTDVLEAFGRAGSDRGTLTEPGLTVQLLTPAIAAATGHREGVVVAQVFEGGPASGVLEPGDVITDTDGQPVGDPESLLLDIGARLAAGPVRVSFIRGQQRRQGQLRIPAPAAATPDSRRERFKLELVRGVGARVVDLDAGSPLAVAGLVSGDIILRIADMAAPTPMQVNSALRNSPPGPPGPSLLLVVRRGSRQHVTAVKREDSDDVSR